MSENIDQEKRGKEAAEVLNRMVQLLGLSASVKSVEPGEKLVLHLAAEEPGRLIGRKGRTLENLEYLVNRAIAAKYSEMQLIVLDVDGYRRNKPVGRKNGRGGEQKPAGHEISEEEQEKLQKMANDIAKEVKRWGEAKEIGPFYPEERKVVHTALKNIPEVVTESLEPEADGIRKKILIRVSESYE